MANITTQTIRVDLSTDKVIPSAFTHQNDTARTLVFDMYNGGMPYTMTGNTVKFAYKSPIVNGQYSVIAGASMASGTVSGNKVSVTLPVAYTQISGVGMLTMIITPTSGTVRPVNIRLVVQKSADGDDTVMGASDFPEGLYDYMDNWLAENEPTEIANLKSDLNQFAEDVLDNMSNAVPFPYSSGNSFNNNGLHFECDGRKLTITGTATGRSTYNVYGTWGATNNMVLDAGETYYLIGADSNFRINFFNSSGSQVNGYVGNPSTIVKIDVPTNATGMQIVYQIANSQIGQTFNTTLNPRIYKWMNKTGRKLGLVFSNTPIEITYGTETTIVIPQNVVILTGQKLITSSFSGTLTITGGANWLTYDATNDEFRLGATKLNAELYTVGIINHANKSCFVLGDVVKEHSQTREWGFIFSNTLPKIKHVSSGVELSIPANTVILAKDGTTSVPNAQTLSFSTANFLSFDVDEQIYRIGQRYQTHRLIVLGVISVERFEACYINGTNLHYDKTIAFMGDSITAGSGTSKTYHQYIGDNFGFTCLNYGYGGSGWVHNYDSTGGLMGTGTTGKGVAITSENAMAENNVLARLQEVPNTVDGIVIFAGTNDWADGGNISFSDFVSGVDLVLDYVQTNYGGVPVIVMTPIHRKNDTVANTHTGKTLTDYVDAIQAECRKYGIMCIDTFSESGLHPDNSGNDTFYFNRDDTGVSDGLHPNHYAHQMLARCIDSVLNKFVTRGQKYMA